MKPRAPIRLRFPHDIGAGHIITKLATKGADGLYKCTCGQRLDIAGVRQHHKDCFDKFGESDEDE